MTTDTDGALRKANGLPCGLTMTVVMFLLILLPITFLVAYSGIPLGQAVSAQSYLSAHRDVFRTVIECGKQLQDERRDSTLYLLTAANATAAVTAARSALTATRTKVNAQLSAMRRGGLNSDMAYRDNFLTTIDALVTSIDTIRQQVLDRTTTGPTFRATFHRIIENVYNQLLLIAKDGRAKELETRITALNLMRRVLNSVDLMRSAGAALITKGVNYDDEDRMDLYSATNALTADGTLVSSVGKQEVIDMFAALTRDIGSNNFFLYLISFRNKNAALWFPINVSTWLNLTTTFMNSVVHHEEKMVDVIVNGNILKDISVDEGMKMMGAVLACIIAAALVAWLNYREQKRMESSLRNTRRLAAAVQRFVPRNQLKTMGVRSITQVTSGLQVEVAQTMLFSDIRDFTGLSEQMKNIELFEWLQSYVSRMTKATVAEKGYVDKFIGDALFCVFPQPTNGLRAAILMHVSTDQLNIELVAEQHQNTVTIGVGLHYGVVVAGVFGDSTRLSCTMVASDVNLASRLEALTKSFGAKIIASEAVISQVDASAYDMRPLGKVQVSGSTQAIRIYDVFQNDTVPLKKLKRNTLQEFTEAVNLADRDPAKSITMFTRLASKAREMGFVDVAAECKSEGATTSAQASVLEFEKNGDHRHSARSHHHSGSRVHSFEGETASPSHGDDVLPHSLGPL